MSHKIRSDFYFLVHLVFEHINNFTYAALNYYRTFKMLLRVMEINCKYYAN